MNLDQNLLRTLAKNSNSLVALRDWVNNDSDFQQHSKQYIIAKRFYADPNENKRIYHYTKMDRLDSILKAKRFYIGSIKDMNDPMEISYTYNLAKKVLKSLGATTSEIDVFNQDRKVTFFEIKDSQNNQIRRKKEVTVRQLVRRFYQTSKQQQQVNELVSELRTE